MVWHHSYNPAGEIEDLEGWCVGKTDVQSIEEGEESGEGDVVGGQSRAVSTSEGVVAAWRGLRDHNRLMVGLV